MADKSSKPAKRLSTDSTNSHEGATAGEISALEEAFRKFAVHGDTRATGKEMHGKNWSKLCKDCHVIDGKNVTTTDVDIVFSKINLKICLFDSFNDRYKLSGTFSYQFMGNPVIGQPYDMA
ncbi:hypothetical protein WISP_75126 [Willisornis vidua]|uniref:Tubulin polymerization-promoting protein n=1 Tax=Willisornis vidua TaxID=1566151 RepID=A0ABQ9D6T3_9PASS|nr:hypothetical protein WISP_75126 [Willisornis vidua]